MAREVARQQTRSEAPAWAGTAFVVEAMVLLGLVVASLAVYVTLFARARAVAAESHTVSEAVVAAADVAELFAADPASVPAQTAAGELVVQCETVPEQRTAGTLYHATIRVYATGDAEPVYTLTTARYVASSGDSAESEVG